MWDCHCLHGSTSLLLPLFCKFNRPFLVRPALSEPRLGSLDQRRYRLLLPPHYSSISILRSRNEATAELGGA